MNIKPHPTEGDGLKNLQILTFIIGGEKNPSCAFIIKRWLLLGVKTYEDRLSMKIIQLNSPSDQYILTYYKWKGKNHTTHLKNVQLNSASILYKIFNERNRKCFEK